MILSWHIWALFVLAEAQDQKKPNVILLMTDDFGMGDFQINNKNSPVPTPNIDRIGREGVNFLDAHSTSSRCGPSRWMMLTGRYRLDRDPNPFLNDLRIPHLGAMFKRNGYNTGLFGKSQPYKDYSQHEDPLMRRQIEENKKVKLAKHPLGWLFTGQPQRPNIFELGQYNMGENPVKYGFDSSFITPPVCCAPANYYENGTGVEESTRYAIQRPYGHKKFKLPYVGPPFFETPQAEIQAVKHAWPLNIVAQAGYDSRYAEERTSEKFLQFIDNNSGKEEPFFVFYAMRSGHDPFNTPVRFRNQSSVGIVGEMTMETDEIVGNMFDALERNKIDNDTVVLFMSDNGSAFRKLVRKLYGHDQNSVTIGDKTYSLRGVKNDIYEGGHRVPFMWWYPSLFPSRVDSSTIVSQMDIYRTLSDLIGGTLGPCEAPDSRSLLPVLTGTGPNALNQKGIIHHGVHKNHLAFRYKSWKWIPVTNELFDFRKDIEEKNNLFFGNDEIDEPWVTRLVTRMNDTLNAKVRSVENREKRTKYGTVHLNICK